jgi:hypothetical protein
VVIIDGIQRWLLIVIYWGLLAFRIWAFVDCLTRKGPAFPAANKLTKPTWALLTGLSAAISALLPPLNLISYVSIIVTAVYMADVRPAVREISGPSRW